MHILQAVLKFVERVEKDAVKHPELQTAARTCRWDIEEWWRNARLSLDDESKASSSKIERKSKVCNWKYYSTARMWMTRCRNRYFKQSSTPSMAYCPFCGQVINQGGGDIDQGDCNG